MLFFDLLSIPIGSSQYPEPFWHQWSRIDQRFLEHVDEFVVISFPGLDCFLSQESGISFQDSVRSVFELDKVVKKAVITWPSLSEKRFAARFEHYFSQPRDQIDDDAFFA